MRPNLSHMGVSKSYNIKHLPTVWHIKLQLSGLPIVVYINLQFGISNYSMAWMYNILNPLILLECVDISTTYLTYILYLPYYLP